MRARRIHRKKTAGFTLVELMVAVTGGLFVSLAVFALAREGSRFYNREARIADATMSAVMGFERLRADLGRAGFLARPNIRKDPYLCGDPVGDTTWPASLKKLASIRIMEGGSPANTTLTAAGVDPDAIVLAGSYSANERFPIWNVENAGGTYVVYLQQNTGPLARLNYNASANKAGLMSSLFGPGRLLRIVDQSGEIQFGTIDSTSVATSPQVILKQTPVLKFRDTAGALCGLKGNVTGASVNVVNLVKYDLRNLKTGSNFGGANADYSVIYDNPHPYDTDRTELVRVELDHTGAPIAGTEELVAEYAVDLQFGITYVETLATTGDPTIKTFEPNNAAIPAWAGDLETEVGVNGPHRVRGLRVQLSVRSQDPDRETNPITTNFHRIGLGPSNSAPFARVRTLQAEIGMHNQMAVFW